MSLPANLLADSCGAPPLVVAHAVAGPRFTAIAGALAPDGAPPAACGVAYTGAGESNPDFDAGAATAALEAQWRGRPLAQMAKAFAEQTGTGQSITTQPAAAGAAALNALLAARRVAEGAAFGEENGLDLIARLSAGKRLVVVGGFPYLKTIRLEAAQSWVLELEPEDDQLPASAAPDVIPQADVVGITGSTLANGTLEGLLALCRRDAFVAIIGPTTPLSPVLFDYGADVLCGSLAQNPAQALESVFAGGSTRRIPGMRQVSLRPLG
jgi:uncharacterized protein (DUF4213/DUF364 family)